jgi:hypothetical protein
MTIGCSAVTFQGAKDVPVRIGDVEETVLALWRTYNRPGLRLDPWQAVGLARRLRARGVTIEEWPYTVQRYGEMASTLFALGATAGMPGTSMPRR